MSNQLTIISLAADENRALKELRFTTRCKNDGVLYTYDFGGKESYAKVEKITAVFVWALYKLRHNMGHVSRNTQRQNLWRFLRFLIEHNIERPQALDGHTLIAYVEWLKRQSTISYSTAGFHFRLLSPTFRQMSKHPDISPNFEPQRNPFPKSSSLQTVNEGYDQEELKCLVHAAVAGMRDTMAKVSTKYTPVWLGKPAPLEDVAPLSEHGGHSLWNSFEYKIWWWENSCDSKRLKRSELSRIPQGEVFAGSFNNASKSGAAGIQDFYDKLGAGVGYVPRYFQKPCPIKYLTPWKKYDYLVWYWENKLGCQVITEPALRSSSPKLYGAIKEHFNGRFRKFYESLGLCAWISAIDLVPFYIMLLIRTQLNPSTVQRLKLNSLRTDPLDASKQSIEWTKYRSSQVGRLIPSDKGQDGWPVMLINKVVQVTAEIREPQQTALWVANANRHKKTMPLGASAFKTAMKEFSKKRNLLTSSGAPLSIQAQLIRPTMAWQEYLRTEDMRYLQTLLGHKKISTTADYLRRISDPVLKFRRGVHIDAMFLNVLSPQVKGHELSDATRLILNSCKNPNESPVAGQKQGDHCTAGHEICLSCPNLVITHADIKTYFCYLRYHDQLLASGVINTDDYKWATSEKKMIWEEQILKRYSPELVAAIRLDAELRPIAVWSQAAEGSW